MNFTLKNEEIQSMNGTSSTDFPKYTSQLINWANQNAQGTRPRVVGQLSDLFPQYLSETDDVSLESYKEWYTQKYPNAITDATDKIEAQVSNLKQAIKLIDRSMIESWVEDLVIDKTYNGFYVQKAILEKLAQLKSETYRLANPSEESQGIDGYVGSVAYSIKPDTYKTMDRLSESINVKMIYYTKKKTGLSIEVED